MIRIVLNRCYGMFSLSEAALSLLEPDIDYSEHENRTDERLLYAIELLGPNASGRNAELSIFEYPEEVTDYEISDYDGYETLTYIVNGKIYHI